MQGMRILMGLVFIAELTRAEPVMDLPPAFLDARPRIQLYQAYARFKSGDYNLARRMWLAVKGAARAEALFNLGVLHEQGLGVVADADQAVAYYREAALLGSRAAAYQLGLMHRLYPQRVDREEARRWLSAAALDGDEEAAELLATLSASAGSQAEKSDDDSGLVAIRTLIAAGQAREAVRQLQARVSTVARGRTVPEDLAALRLLAWLYESGLGVPRDLEQAARLFRQAAEGGDARAQYALAVMLATGRGQTADPDAARRWLKRAANQGYQPARLQLQAAEP